MRKNLSLRKRRAPLQRVSLSLPCPSRQSVFMCKSFGVIFAFAMILSSCSKNTDAVVGVEALVQKETANALSTIDWQQELDANGLQSAKDAVYQNNAYNKNAIQIEPQTLANANLDALALFGDSADGEKVYPLYKDFGVLNTNGAPQNVINLIDAFLQSMQNANPQKRTVQKKFFAKEFDFVTHLVQQKFRTFSSISTWYYSSGVYYNNVWEMPVRVEFAGDSFVDLLFFVQSDDNLLEDSAKIEQIYFSE